jgi:hypothetical protein
MKSIGLIIVGALLGFFTATMAISERAASSIQSRAGVWSEIANAPDAEIDPYLSARYASVGWLLPPQGDDQLLEASTDSEGSALDGDCRYLVSGKWPSVRWWQVAVIGDDDVVNNDARARPEAISSERVIGEANGEYRITLAREASPGNWISPGRGNRVRLLLTVHRDSKATTNDAVPPTITRVSCG